jgi:sialate O-acetylesterase
MDRLPAMQALGDELNKLRTIQQILALDHEKGVREAELAEADGFLAEAEEDLSEAQAKFAAEQPNAAIAIINDLGNTVDIHPNRKQAVAQRLALHAFKRLYGYTHIQDNSPTLKDWRIEGDKFILSFRDVKRFYVYNMDRSLKTGFEICGADGAWKSADIQNFRVTKTRRGKESRQGELVGTEVVVSSKDVPQPVRLRYLHSAPWFGALYNEVNLPVGAFHVGKEGN